MSRHGTVKLSSIAGLEGTPLNPDYLLRVKERLDARDAEETPESFREEAAAMRYEAADRLANAKVLKVKGEAILAESRAERHEAEAMTNTSAQTLSRRLGM